MLLDLHEWLFALQQFFQTGGWVLYLILGVSVAMFSLIFERLLFCFGHYRQHKNMTRHALGQAENVSQKRALMCDLDMALSAQFPLIKSLIMLCPLVGLLGTVTGMIQVFDAMAVYGTGNPRLMAAGVASATLPTMTGMAVAVVGLLFYSRLSRWAELERQHLRTSLSAGGER